MKMDEVWQDYYGFDHILAFPGATLFEYKEVYLLIKNDTAMIYKTYGTLSTCYHYCSLRRHKKQGMTTATIVNSGDVARKTSLSCWGV
ncbi:MAG: hypothetical protein IPN33_26135 [Saprospiraceae bacterium]|nr:hypothetical protein [Saprospiraceae bacterium]